MAATITMRAYAIASPPTCWRSLAISNPKALPTG